MKNLRDKFNHWRNLLPYMKLEDAASKIQALFRGYDLRKDFKRFNRLNEKIINLYENPINTISNYKEKSD